MLGQRRKMWVNIDTALGECHVFADVLAQSIPQTQYWSSVGAASLTIDRIEPTMGCDAGPTLNQNWVGRPTSCVRGTLWRHAAERFTGKIEWTLTSSSHGGGINTV